MGERKGERKECERDKESSMHQSSLLSAHSTVPPLPHSSHQVERPPSVSRSSRQSRTIAGRVHHETGQAAGEHLLADVCDSEHLNSA